MRQFRGSSGNVKVAGDAVFIFKDFHMNAPKIPGHTCPLIDKIQGAIERAHKIADNFDAEDVKDFREALRDIRHELNGESDALEEVRAANLALRNAAEYWMEKAEEFEG